MLRNSDFTHLESEVYATARGHVASGDKLPSDHSSKTDVRGQCDNCWTGNLSLPELQMYTRYLIRVHIEMWVSNLFLAHNLEKNPPFFCVLLRSAGTRSVLVHMVCTGCSYCTAVTVSRIEQMSPLKAFFSYTHGLYYHHEIKLKTCPFRHHNDRVILGRWARTKWVQYCVLQNHSA